MCMLCVKYILCGNDIVCSFHDVCMCVAHSLTLALSRIGSCSTRLVNNGQRLKITCKLLRLHGQ